MAARDWLETRPHDTGVHLVRARGNDMWNLQILDKSGEMRQYKGETACEAIAAAMDDDVRRGTIPDYWGDEKLVAKLAQFEMRFAAIEKALKLKKGKRK